MRGEPRRTAAVDTGSMTLAEFLDRAADATVTLRLYAPEPVPALETHFQTRNVEVVYVPFDVDPGFLVVRDAAGFRGAVDASVLTHLVEPSVGRRSDRPVGLDVLLDLLEDTRFRSLRRAHLLATSREFEDRAARVGTGRLLVGFQSERALAAQRGTYARLAAETALDIHLYLQSDADVDPPAGTAVHTEADEGELGEYWLLALQTLDGEQDCALLARERADGFEGFWTYDSALVDDITTYLGETYGPAPGAADDADRRVEDAE